MLPCHPLSSWFRSKAPRFAINPWRDRCWINPQAYLRVSCFFLQLLKLRIQRRILPIPPTPALFDEVLVDLGAIQQEHAFKGAPI